LGADPKQAEPTSKRQTKKRLTFDLLLLRLEGLVRGFSHLLQAKDRSLLFLDGLALIREGGAQLGQLPVEPRDFFVPLLEGRLRPLVCDALPLKEALGLFSCQVLMLEGSTSLSKCGPLLLELSLRLLARVSLLPKLFLRRGEGGGLVRAKQVDLEIPVHEDPGNPSQTLTKVAACEIALGAKLCNSTP
jgi:hypothetical protein